MVPPGLGYERPGRRGVRQWRQYTTGLRQINSAVRFRAQTAFDPLKDADGTTSLVPK